MKKILIAGAGIAALGLAILPTAGTFADVTDTITVTISGSCSVGSTDSKTGSSNAFSATIANGASKEWAPTSGEGNGGKLYVSCNDNSGWHVNAIGGDGTGAAVTDMVKTGGGTGISTGATFSGNDSAWGMKLAGSGVESGYSSNYVVIPATSTKVAGGNGAVSENLIYTGYKVYVSATQASGTYTGKVTYTVAEGVN